MSEYKDAGALGAGMVGSFPNTRDALNEVRFWVRILKEHSLFISLSLPCSRQDLIAEAQRFYELFQGLQNRVESRTTLDQNLIAELRHAVEALIAFKHKLMRMLVTCELRGPLYPLLLDHITREAIHFLDFLNCRPCSDTLVAILKEQSFFLRIMKEHIEFIISLLDPSERELLAQAQASKEVFSDLLETARDLKSMARSRTEHFNRVIQFTETVTQRVTELRNFKATAHELAVLCRLLSAIPDPLLLDHVRREADKFLQELKDMRALLRRWECR
jgi:hypothetical protein